MDASVTGRACSLESTDNGLEGRAAALWGG